MPHQMNTIPRHAAALIILSLTSTALSSSDDPPHRPPTPAPPPQTLVMDIQLVRPPSHGLLREGSHLLQAQGHFTLDPETSSWLFTVKPSSPNSPVHTLAVLPSSFLSEAQQVVRSSPEYQLRFELNGEVTVYKGRNYLLLTQSPRVVGHTEETTPETPETHSEPTEPTESAEDAPADESPDQPRDAASIMRDLQEQAGPVQRRVTTRNTTDAQDRSAALSNNQLKREGSSIIMRRGRINRHATGDWLFVFEADASGNADPPMTLMPCLMLQRLERHYQTRGNAPILLSGRVFVYEGRNYLMPTVFQLARDRNIIMP